MCSFLQRTLKPRHAFQWTSPKPARLPIDYSLTINRFLMPPIRCLHYYALLCPIAICTLFSLSPNSQTSFIVKPPIERGEAPKCCLTAANLCSRIISACPIAIFRCQAVEFGIFDLLTRTWRDASLHAGAPSPPNRHNPPPSPFMGPVTRSICLSAIELLVNHHDADVSSCCVKTLMPQVS